MASHSAQLELVTERNPSSRQPSTAIATRTAANGSGVSASAILLPSLLLPLALLLPLLLLLWVARAVVDAGEAADAVPAAGAAALLPPSLPPATAAAAALLGPPPPAAPAPPPPPPALLLGAGHAPPSSTSAEMASRSAASRSPFDTIFSCDAGVFATPQYAQSEVLNEYELGQHAGCLSRRANIFDFCDGVPDSGVRWPHSRVVARAVVAPVLSNSVQQRTAARTATLLENYPPQSMVRHYYS